ncbi:hypothetical protein HDU83_003822 [Entophlyctis luteolus]|nr:hypothetical protein HDU82_001155 [Entophlyctis luteolus]KAJ3355245.1 hypothetical protein HDU83_003822 [Entophlyctis luteolus]KAJ3386140.1 hypothetical protein HDU84_001782 [Entophlyctis sp. JEL0112]
MDVQLNYLSQDCTARLVDVALTPASPACRSAAKCVLQLPSFPLFGSVKSVCDVPLAIPDIPDHISSLFAPTDNYALMRFFADPACATPDVGFPAEAKVVGACNYYPHKLAGTQYLSNKLILTGNDLLLEFFIDGGCMQAQAGLSRRVGSSAEAGSGGKGECVSDALLGNMIVNLPNADDNEL